MLLTEKVNQYIRDNSGYEQRRAYLGMSGINHCPRIQYERFFHGQKPSELHHRKSYQGYLFEREVKKILAATGLYRPGSERELVAPWDPRFLGHTDGEDCKGGLNEIKSMHPRAFEEIVSTGKLKHATYWQVQAYMRYGGYDKSTVWVVNTEVFELFPIKVFPSDTVQERVEVRARMILHAIDSKTPPACICGHCNF